MHAERHALSTAAFDPPSTDMRYEHALQNAFSGPDSGALAPCVSLTATLEKSIDFICGMTFCITIKCAWVGVLPLNVHCLFVNASIESSSRRIDAAS